MKFAKVSDSILLPPDSEDDVQSEASRLLKRAKAIGIYPTPIEPLMEAAKLHEITDFQDAKEGFLHSASAQVRANLESAFSKLRGLADLKRKAIFVTPDNGSPRERWARLHEVGHQWLPWQHEQYAFLDDSRSLSPDCEELFDIEANCFASELLFQGEKFQELARSYRPDFNTIFNLANLHGASNHATARRFAEQSDEPTALVSYFKSKYSIDESGRPMMILGRSHSASEKFLTKYGATLLPAQLDSAHPWVEALKASAPVEGTIRLTDGDSSPQFLWQSWWNQHHLLVLVRRKPTLAIVRKMIVG